MNPLPQDGRRVLLTGASGFIGSALEARLLRAGHRVFSVSRTPSAPVRHPDGLVELAADLHRPGEVAAVVGEARPDLCFHLAWYAEPSDYLTDVGQNLAWVGHSLELVDRLLSAGCTRMVMAGSCAEYQLGPSVLDETAPAIPATMYGAAKLAVGTAAVAAARQVGAHLSWARIFYVYGPGEDPRRVVPRLVRSLCGDGLPPRLSSQPKDYLHVDDVAGALETLGERGHHGPVNVCSGQGVSTLALRSLLASSARAQGLDVEEGPEPERGSSGPPIIGDATMLGSTGWRAGRGLSEGLAETLRWWRSRR